MTDELIDDTSDRAKARARRRKLAVIAAPITALGLGLVWAATELPRRAGERAEQRTYDCVNAIYNSGEGDPADCRQTGLLLQLARTLPWTRDAARQQQSELEETVLRHQLYVASMRDFDVELRDQAGRALVDLHRSEYPPDALSGAFYRLCGAGAHELTVELVSEEDSTIDRNLALKTALLLGDWESAGRIARTSAEGDSGFARNAAIVACILGDRETATARLDEADRAWREYDDKPLPDVLWIALHCELPREPGEPLDDYLQSSLETAAKLYEPGGKFDKWSYHRHEQTMSVARLAVTQTEPIVWNKDLRGQIEEAQAIHQVAREIAAAEEFRPFALVGQLPLLGLYALLAPDEAASIVRSVPAEQLAASPPGAQVMLSIQFALVHEQIGELDRAVELAGKAVELLPQLPAGNLTTLGVDTGARWVHGALLFRAGREGSLGLESLDDLRGKSPDGSDVFAYWWTAARADPAAQVGYRWRSGGESNLWLVIEPWSLASALELLARSGPADKRELWLDTVSADIIDDPLDLIRARASAAERLGDTAAAERWHRREAALTERLRDDRAAALYRLLE